MKGTILGFNTKLKEGVIISDNDERYSFDIRDWKEEIEPYKGLRVDFEVENGKAKNIYASVENLGNLSENIYANSSNKNMWEIYMDVIKNHYADFDGRTRRRTFWLFALMDFLMTLGIVILSGLLSGLFGSPIFLYILPTLYILFMFIPRIALTTRRLHDIGKSGWWQLITLIPYIGGIILLIFLVIKSDPMPNKYGEVPIYE